MKIRKLGLISLWENPDSFTLEAGGTEIKVNSSWNSTDQSFGPDKWDFWYGGAWQDKEWKGSKEEAIERAIKLMGSFLTSLRSDVKEFGKHLSDLDIKTL